MTTPKIKGQATVEAFVALPVLMLFLILFFNLFHWGFSYFLMDHLAYEAALCSESNPSRQCLEDLKRRAQILPGLSVVHTQTSETARHRQVAVRWQSLFYFQKTSVKVDLSQLSSPRRF